MTELKRLRELGEKVAIEWTIDDAAFVRRNLTSLLDAAERVERLREWAVERWNAEVSNRPLNNVHRRTLDDTWRQVIRYTGADPFDLVGFAHDELLAAPPVAEKA